jgi:hypothetical protein
MLGGKAPLRLATQKSRPHAPLAQYACLLSLQMGEYKLDWPSWFTCCIATYSGGYWQAARSSSSLPQVKIFSAGVFGARIRSGSCPAFDFSPFLLFCVCVQAKGPGARQQKPLPRGASL